MTTIGTAGKVFLNEPGEWKPYAVKKNPCCKPCGKLKSLAEKIDHTNLRPDASESDIRKLCEESRAHGFAAVCVNPCWVPLAVRSLKGSGVKICTVVGFPLGAAATSVKVFEACQAIADGADEIDMVMNVGALKSKDFQTVRSDMRAVREAAKGKILKVILETALLNREEIVRASLYVRESGAEFVKTSTGFSSRGASAEDVKIIREAAGPRIKIKAAGGIRTRAFAEALINAGADRIGASASVLFVAQNSGGDEKNG